MSTDATKNIVTELDTKSYNGGTAYMGDGTLYTLSGWSKRWAIYALSFHHSEGNANRTRIEIWDREDHLPDAQLIQVMNARNAERMPYNKGPGTFVSRSLVVGASVKDKLYIKLTALGGSTPNHATMVIKGERR